MALLFYLFYIVAGTILTLIGYKIYNPFKNEADPEKEIEFYKKSGNIFKIGGPLLLIFGIFQTVTHFL